MEIKEVENQLRRYFNRNNLKDLLDKKLNILDSQIRSIDKDLKECNITLIEESSSPSFDERVQTSSDGTSYAERQAIRVTEMQIERLTKKQMERQRVLEQIDILEIEANEIEWKLRDIKEEHLKILELKYKDNLSEKEIANKVHMVQPRINGIKQSMLRQIAMTYSYNDAM
jgi:predicted XRE-type DNA-binding protein